MNWNWLGALLAKLGRYDEARDAFQHAVDVAPDHIYRPLENLGTLYLYEADYEAAIETYEKIPEPIPYALASQQYRHGLLLQG